MVDDTTLDTLLGKRLQLRQPRKGHRAGTDAVLVAAATPAEAGQRVVDLGAGVGTVGLAVAQRVPDTHVTLVEIDTFLAKLAQENIALNGLENRACVICGDVGALARKGCTLKPHSIDHVVANPPFYPNTGKVSPDPRTARARMTTDGLMEQWARTAARLLKAGGSFTVIHRPDALAEILAAFERRFGNLAVLPVLPFAHEPAVRILVQGIAGSKAPLRLLPPLVLRDKNGAITPEMEALHTHAESILL